MKRKNKKAITVCSSASFFKQALEVEKELKALGFTVKLPYTAHVMKKSGDFKTPHTKSSI